jgi:hypothetical protein
MTNPLMGPALIQPERAQIVCSVPGCWKFMDTDAVCTCRKCGDPFCSKHVDDFELDEPTCLKCQRMVTASDRVRLERVG